MISIQNRATIHWPAKCARVLILALILAISFGTVKAADIWSKGDIAGLFPPAPDGWRISRIELDALDLPTTEFERFANALNEDFEANAAMRLRAVRHYISDGKKISVTMDSSDIDAAINIDAMTAAFASGDDATQTQLERDGFYPLTHDGLQGVAIKTPDKTGRAFKVGSVGVVALECSYFDCSDLLKLMTEQINFNDVAEFVAFEHRPQDP